MRDTTLRPTWKERVKHAIPPPLLNETLVRFPFLYRTNLIYYETNLRAAGGVDELLEQLETVLNIEGHIIECGSSRCGTSLIMAEYLRRTGVKKKIFACDSFAGFDRAELQREKAAGLTSIAESAFTSTSYQYVRRKIVALGSQDIVTPVKGYFQEVLPDLAGPFCLALVDCDLKESLVYCAETLWPRLSRGGCLLFDDYLAPDFRGAKQGVDLFVTNHRAEISEHRLLKRLYFLRKA